MRFSTLSRTDIAQARTIARATFDGFLQSDLMPAGMQATAIIWGAAFLIAPGMFLPVQYMSKYPFLRRFFPGRVESALWNDRLLFILLSAGAMGLVAVVLWDTLFPARRDAFVLTPMPVPLPVQMLGRLGGVLTLYAAFAIGLNILPAFAFPLVALPGFIQMPRAIAGHLVATAAADAFVFFSVTAVQGGVILAFGRRVAARLAAFAQAAAVLVLLLTLMFMGPVRDLTARAIVAGPPSSPALRLVPTSWFLGVYEWIAGSPRPVMAGLAWRGLLAGVVPVAMTIAVYALGYRRLLVRAVETPQRSTRAWYARAAAYVVRMLIVRRPQEQAIAGFTLRAISRSGRHSMLMAIYVGVGLALMMTALITDVARFGNDALWNPMAAWPYKGGPPLAVLMAPLMLSAALAIGVRVLITIPAEMGARWIFQTTALAPQRVGAAVHKTMLLIVMPPVIALAAVPAAVLWGRQTVLPHAAFCASLTLALCELLLIRHHGAPLTRPYVPGRSRVLVMWALYLSAFFTYTYSMAALERALFLVDGSAAVVQAAEVFSGVAIVLWVWRIVTIRREEDVPFEAEAPHDEMFQGFNLSEIHTAQVISTRKDSVAQLK